MPKSVSGEAVSRHGWVSGMGAEPWPTDGDAATNGFTFFEVCLTAGEEYWGLISWDVVYDLGSVKGNSGGGKVVVDPDGGEAGADVFEPEFERDFEVAVGCLSHGVRLHAGGV